MNKDLVLKTIGGIAFVIGVGSVATAMYARYRKTKDEEATIDALVKTEVIANNFSGANGWNPIVYKCIRNGKVYFSRIPCPKGEGTTPPRTCYNVLIDITNLNTRLKSIVAMYNANPSDELRDSIKSTKIKLAQLEAEYAKLSCGGVRRDTGDYCVNETGNDSTWQGTGGHAGYCRPTV